MSKTVAEQEAWALAKQHSLDLVAILPEFVMGPLLSTRVDGTSFGYMKVRTCGGAGEGSGRRPRLHRAEHNPASLRTRARVQAWVEGKAQSGAPVFADVRDVARAHVLAAETPAAKGRYIVANSHTLPASQISAWLKVSAPACPSARPWLLCARSRAVRRRCRSASPCWRSRTERRQSRAPPLTTARRSASWGCRSRRCAARW